METTVETTNEAIYEMMSALAVAIQHVGQQRKAAIKRDDRAAWAIADATLSVLEQQVERLMNAVC
jgi:hypothetical protein